MQYLVDETLVQCDDRTRCGAIKHSLHPKSFFLFAKTKSTLSDVDLLDAYFDGGQDKNQLTREAIVGVIFGGAGVGPV